MCVCIDPCILVFCVFCVLSVFLRSPCLVEALACGGMVCYIRRMGTPRKHFNGVVTKSAMHDPALVSVAETKWAFHDPGNQKRGAWSRLVNHLLTQYVACGAQDGVQRSGHDDLTTSRVLPEGGGLTRSHLPAQKPA